MMVIETDQPLGFDNPLVPNERNDPMLNEMTLRKVGPGAASAFALAIMLMVTGAGDAMSVEMASAAADVASQTLR